MPMEFDAPDLEPGAFGTLLGVYSAGGALWSLATLAGRATVRRDRYAETRPVPAVSPSVGLRHQARVVAGCQSRLIPWRCTRVRRRLASVGALTKVGRYRTPSNTKSNWTLFRSLPVTPPVIDFLPMMMSLHTLCRTPKLAEHVQRLS